MDFLLNQVYDMKNICIEFTLIISILHSVRIMETDYPPEHSKFDGCSSKTSKSNASMYYTTMDRMRLIKTNTGHRMFYVWGHEFLLRRNKLFDSVEKILHEA